MYKPPQNTNRVWSLRSKFENLEHTKTDNSHSPNEVEKVANKNNQEKKTYLEKQMSNPLKKYIKRSPAFRIDKTIAENPQTSPHSSRVLFENKLKQYNIVKNNCDTSNNDNNVEENDEHHLNRNTQDLYCLPHEPDNTIEKNISVLYTELIPKALRKKKIIKKSDESNMNTLNYNKIIKTESVPSSQLSDTLKMALNKPLPLGPAPVKPPRTFQHFHDYCSIKENNSFLHLKSDGRESHLKPKKTDPKYMLNKLEIALRNNTLCTKKHYKTDISTTSGEDSDDSLLFRSKSHNLGSKLLDADSDSTSTFNFNCLGIMKCSRSEYGKHNEPGSSFFIHLDDPVYVEPYHYLKDMPNVIQDNKKGL